MTTKVTSEFLHQAIISDHTQVSAASADHVLIHDASDNTLKKALISTITGTSSVAADDIAAGDAAITISTSSGNITIDNGSSDDDIIFKGTDGGSDITALTLDMSDAGTATFNHDIKLSDLSEVTFGAGNDMVLYSDGSHGIVSCPSWFQMQSGTGEFYFYKGVTFGFIKEKGSGSDLYNMEIGLEQHSKQIEFTGVDSSYNTFTMLTLDAADAGTATFNHDIKNVSGDMKIDVVGSIILDADNNGEISFQDAGTEIGKIFSNSSDFTFEAGVQDKDIVFRGNDGGTAITPFRLDMSTGGRALFYSDLVALETAGQYLQVAGSSSNYWAIGSTGGNNTPGTASTTLAFHHYNGSAWNNEVEFDSSGNITLDGSIVFSNNSKLRQDSAGLIMETLDSDEDLLFIGNDGGNVIIAARMDMSDGGHLICNNNVTAFGNTSDIKLKENIEIISNPLDKVKQLKGVTFNYKKDGRRSTGLIAQDLEKVLPEVVYETSDIDNDEEKHLAVRYGNTVGLLVEAIKELEARVKELEGK